MIWDSNFHSILFYQQKRVGVIFGKLLRGQNCLRNRKNKNNALYDKIIWSRRIREHLKLGGKNIQISPDIFIIFLTHEQFFSERTSTKGWKCVGGPPSDNTWANLPTVLLFFEVNFNTNDTQNSDFDIEKNFARKSWNQEKDAYSSMPSQI